jgi:hypothetical protein
MELRMYPWVFIVVLLTVFCMGFMIGKDPNVLTRSAFDRRDDGNKAQYKPSPCVPRPGK